MSETQLPFLLRVQTPQAPARVYTQPASKTKPELPTPPVTPPPKVEQVEVDAPSKGMRFWQKALIFLAVLVVYFALVGPAYAVSHRDKIDITLPIVVYIPIATMMPLWGAFWGTLQIFKKGQYSEVARYAAATYTVVSYVAALIGVWYWMKRVRSANGPKEFITWVIHMWFIGVPITVFLLQIFTMLLIRKVLPKPRQGKGDSVNGGRMRQREASAVMEEGLEDFYCPIGG